MKKKKKKKKKKNKLKRGLKNKEPGNEKWIFQRVSNEERKTERNG